MKPRSSLLVALLALAACGDPDDSGALPDGGVTSDSKLADAPPATFTCSHTRVLPTYPWGVTVGAYFADRRLTFGIKTDSTSNAGSRMVLELYPQTGGAEPQIPQLKTLSPTDKYATCETCLWIGEGCTTNPNQCRTYYFAQGGQFRINDAGRSEAAGKLFAIGTNVTFVEWSMSADAPVANGRCIQVANATFDTEWGDGGTCSGDSCSSSNPCCGDSPYCTLGNNNIGRYCSDYCGESGDGCTGPSDCCAGFECFLGTCMVDSCGANPCTAGLDEGGGCCDQAAYCVNGSCSSACGMAGTTCGGDLDCCTGLHCNGGTCN